jgi:hypothetical protein
VTGSLSVSSLAGATASAGASTSSVAYTLPAGSVGYSFTFALTNDRFNDTGAPNPFLSAGITLTDNSSVQTVGLATFLGDPHFDTYITLIGPEGSLFANVNDLASLHAGPGVTIASPVFVGQFLNGGATVAITGVAFAPVPEPAAWTLLAAALPLAIRTAMPGRRRLPAV